jgi:hypothetical protein
MTKRPKKPHGTDKFDAGREIQTEDNGLGATDETLPVSIPGQTAPETGPARPRRPPGAADEPEVGSDPPGPGPLLP